MVKTSIIVPVYNRGEDLRYTLNSIVNQNFKEIEIILVDDNSSDISYDIMLEYQKKDDRIKVLKNKLKGAGAARNLGLEAASGETVIFLDSDDIFHPDLVLDMYNKFKEDNADITVCGFQTAKGSNYEKFDLDKELKNQKNPIRFNKIKNDIFSCIKPFCWNKLYKRAFIEEHKITFLNTEISEDLYFTVLAAAHAKKISFVDKNFILWVRHNSSISTKKCFENFLDIEIYRKLKCRLKLENLYEKYKFPLMHIEFQSYYDAIKEQKDEKNRLLAAKKVKAASEFSFLSYLYCIIFKNYRDYRFVSFAILKFFGADAILCFMNFKHGKNGLCGK